MWQRWVLRLLNLYASKESIRVKKCSECKFIAACPLWFVEGHDSIEGCPLTFAGGHAAMSGCPLGFVGGYATMRRYPLTSAGVHAKIG